MKIIKSIYFFTPFFFLNIFFQNGVLFAQENPKLDQEIIVFEKQLQVAKNKKDTLEILRTTYLLTKNLSDKSQYIKAETILVRTLKSTFSAKYASQKGLVILQLARVYSLTDQIQKASKNFNSAKQIFLSQKDWQNYTTSLIDIAEYNRRFDEEKKGLVFIDSSLKSYQDHQLSDQLILSRIYNRKAAILNQMFEYDGALEYSKKALLIAQLLKNIDLQATCYNEIGSILSKQKKVKLAIFNLEKAEKLWLSIGAERDALNAIRNEAILYGENQVGSKKVIAIYQRFIEITKNKHAQFRTNVMNNIMRIELAEAGDTASAYKYLLKELEAKEEDNRIDFRTQLHAVTEKYENEKIKKEVVVMNDKVKSTNQLLEQKKWETLISYLFSFGFLAFASIISWLLIMSKKAKNTIEVQKNNLSKSLTEKEILLKELHHRVKNNLQVIIGLMHLNSGKTDDETAKEVFNDATNKIGSMALVHQMLFSQDDFANIQANEYLNNLSKQILHSFDSHKITTNIICKCIEISMNKAIPLGLIITELMTNAYKHAFDSNQGIISLELTENNTNLVFSYQDNGKGLPPDFEKKNTKSMGMKLINMLVEEMNGTILIANNNGLQITITFANHD